MMTASVASQLMSTCGQGPGLDKMAKDSDFFLRMVAIRIPSLSGPAQLARAACKVSARPSIARTPKI